MQGTLQSFSLAEILRVIFNERLSGELLMRQNLLEKRIYFERGHVVFASSNRLEDRLGETLARYRKLTREQVEVFVAKLLPGQHFGRALVQAGVINDRELITYVTLQIIDIIYSLFDWTDGTYQFIEGDNRAPEGLKMKFSTATLILEGIRRIDDFDLIRRGIGDPAMPLMTPAAGRSKIKAIAFSPLELSIINMTKEPTDLLKIVVSCKDRPDKVLQAIYGLLVIGIMEQVRTIANVQGIGYGIGTQARFFEPSPALASAGVDGMLLAEIENMKQRIETRNPHIILGIGPGNNANEIYEVYLKLASRFHPDKYLSATPQFKVEVDSIFTAIADSYNMVRAGSPSMGSQVQMAGSIPGISRPSILPPNTSVRSSGSHPVAWQTGSYQPGFYGPGQTPPPPNPMAQYQPGVIKRNAITRAVSDEIEYKGNQQEQAIPQKLDFDRALGEMLDYFDDRRAAMFASEALSLLLRTKAPLSIDRRRVVEAIISWARNKSSVMGWPIPIVLLRVISLVKQAEQARLIENFDGPAFYPAFIKDLAGYCNPSEADEFMRCVGSV
jgi:hypothetical protein